MLIITLNVIIIICYLSSERMFAVGIPLIFDFFCAVMDKKYNLLDWRQRRSSRWPGQLRTASRMTVTLYRGGDGITGTETGDQDCRLQIYSDVSIKLHQSKQGYTCKFEGKPVQAAALQTSLVILMYSAIT